MSSSVRKTETVTNSGQGVEQVHSAIENLEKLYELRGRDQVASFISNNLFLNPLLNEAHSRIKGYFPGASLFLESFSQPEAPEESYLTIFINPALKAKEAIQKLDQLDAEWWADTLSSTQGKLSINLEFT
jgi:hypothetical protein